MAPQKGDALALFPSSARLKRKGQYGKQDERVHEKSNWNKEALKPH